MTRPTYQLSEREMKKAAANAAYRETQLAEAETHREDKTYWKRRRTTYGLFKRDLCREALKGDAEYFRGRGQGIIDRILSLPYTEERENSAFNMGYHDGYRFSPGEVRDLLTTNPNFNTLLSPEEMTARLSQIRREQTI